MIGHMALRILQNKKDPSMWYAALPDGLVPLLKITRDGYLSREFSGYTNIVKFTDAIIEVQKMATPRNDNTAGGSNPPALDASARSLGVTALLGQASNPSKRASAQQPLMRVEISELDNGFIVKCWGAADPNIAVDLMLANRFVDSISGVQDVISVAYMKSIMEGGK